jgi:uncharacterized protein (DUF2236 family)
VFPSDAEVDNLLLGPDSVAWQRASDVRLQLVMLYPLLLQVAHPTVAAGVHDFSDFEQRPWERLQRTLYYLSVLMYGGRDAIAAGRRLRTLHRRFKGVREDGERYSALEPEAYAWVHATLIDSFVAGHAHFGHPMSGEETERFYHEYRGLGRLIGVGEAELPPDWLSFKAYFARMIDERLQQTESVDRVMRAVQDAGAPIPIPGPLWRAIRFPARRALVTGGVGLLEPALRRRLGIRWSVIDEAQFRTLGMYTRGLDPLMPGWLKITGPAHLRWGQRWVARQRPREQPPGAGDQEVAVEPAADGAAA